jgi:hypothetical protein
MTDGWIYEMTHGWFEVRGLEIMVFNATSGGHMFPKPLKRDIV